MIRTYIQRMGHRNPDCIFEQLDPRNKLIILFVITILIILGESVTSFGLFMSVGLLAFFSRLTKLFIFTASFSIFFWLIFILLYHYAFEKSLDNPKAMFDGMVFKGTALTITGLWFAMTTKLRDFTVALETWKIPITITLPLTIAVRFIPTLLNESLIILDAMRLRQIARSKLDLLKKPHLIGQSYFALVIIRSLKMADELAAVAETRGLAKPVNRISSRNIKFKKNDYCALSILVVLVAIFIVLSCLMEYIC